MIEDKPYFFPMGLLCLLFFFFFVKRGKEEFPDVVFVSFEIGTFNDT